ncbi:MAG: spermidine synthase, partial [Verrucomicrobiota bacterium]
IESSVALAKEEDGLGFIVNGRADGNAKSDAGMQVMFGLIGAALHPNPTKAMVDGLGTGSTAGWVAAVPSVR